MHPALPSLVVSPSPATVPAIGQGFFRRALDAVLYSSGWLAAAAAAQTAATFRNWSTTGDVNLRVVALVLAATLLVYNLDAVLPFKHRQPAAGSGRKAWQQRHRRVLAALAGDLAAAETGQAGLVAGDLVRHIGPALATLTAQPAF